MADIDIGPGATDRASYWYGNSALIDMANPANAAGHLTSVEIWVNTYMDNVYLFTATSQGGGDFIVRDWAEVGGFSSGKHVITASYGGDPLNLEVAAGDYIGVYWYRSSGTGAIEADESGGSGVYYASDEDVDSGDLLDSKTNGTVLSFGFHSGYAISVYGEGDLWTVTEVPAQCAMSSTSSMISVGALSASAAVSMISRPELLAEIPGVFGANCAMLSSSSMLADASRIPAPIPDTIEDLLWEGDLASGEVLVIDTERQLVTLDGVNAVKYLTGDWIKMVPGDISMVYQDDSVSRTVDFHLEWRAMWL